MRVYRRPGSTVWHYDIYHPVTGERVRASSHRTVKREAEQVAANELKKMMDATQLGVVGETTVDEAFKVYRDKKIAEGVSWDVDGIYRKLTQRMEGRSGFDPKLPFHLLTNKLVSDWRTARRLEGAAPGTVNNEIVFLNAAYEDARKAGYRVDPAVQCSKYPEVVKLRFLDEDEEDRFLAQLDPDKPATWGDRTGGTGTYLAKPDSTIYRQRRDAYDLAVFLLDTGARYGEVATIPWSGCIDTNDWETIAIYRWKVKNYGTLIMTDRLREVLQRRFRASNSEYVFPGYKSYAEDATDEDKPRGKSTKALRAALDRANCNTDALVKRYGRATAHSLRDTFATRLRRQGVQLDELKDLLGHSDIKMTMRYAHINANTTATNAASILNRVHAARAVRVLERKTP